MGVERHQGTAYNSPFLNGGRRLLDTRAVFLVGARAEVGSDYAARTLAPRPSGQGDLYLHVITQCEDNFYEMAATPATAPNCLSNSSGSIFAAAARRSFISWFAKSAFSKRIMYLRATR